jgi:prepilin-type N-terminal cleavage/methylation domain-containing protein
MKRSAFTLVELLVVVVIIALLVALLIPAINGARTAARTTQCIARQRDLALAMTTYSNGNNGLPGYLNELGATPIHSWAVAVFPMIGENKRYEVLMNLEQGKSPDDKAKEEESLYYDEVIVSIPALLCPADNPEEIARLNYVVNCGPVAEAGITGDNAPALTLFKDRRAGLTSINKKVKIEEIPDGTSNTILLSENLDAGFWHKHEKLNFGWHYWTDISESGDCELKQSSGDYTRDNVSVGLLGFIWSTQKDNTYAPNVFTYPPVTATHIPVPRPSSKHPGVVVAAYADGVAKKVSDDISIEAWLKAVCPDDEKLPTE